MIENQDDYPPPNQIAIQNKDEIVKWLNENCLEIESIDEDVMGGYAIYLDNGAWICCSNTGDMGFFYEDDFFTLVEGDTVKLMRLIDPSKRIDVLKNGLTHPNLHFRDEVMRAAENWEDKNLIPILEQHQEPVKWLDQYRLEVIKWLKGLK